MSQIHEKRWRSVLYFDPPYEGWIGECLVIIVGEKDAGYTRGSYRWYKGQFTPNGPVPLLGGDVVLTHWLDDPNVPPPLPEGWPDCDIKTVNNWLIPYRQPLAKHDAMDDLHRQQEAVRIEQRNDYIRENNIGTSNNNWQK